MSDYFKRAHDNIAVEHPEFCRAWVQQFTVPSPNDALAQSCNGPEVGKKGEEGQALREALERFRCELIDGQIVKESDGEPWPLSKSEANQIVAELGKRLAAAPASLAPPSRVESDGDRIKEFVTMWREYAASRRMRAKEDADELEAALATPETSPLPLDKPREGEFDGYRTRKLS